MMTATFPKLSVSSPQQSDTTPLFAMNKRFALQSLRHETDWNGPEPLMPEPKGPSSLPELPPQALVTTPVNEVEGADEKNETYLNPFRHSLLKHIKLDKKIIRAKGHYLFDANDNKYLDFLAQYGAVPFGYNPSFLWANIQSSFFTDTPSLIQPFISIAAERLAQQLTALYPADMRYATFSNSGAESVEVALKIARAKTQRKTILSVKNGFHGKTLGALSATGNPHYQDPFLVDTTQYETVSLNDQAELDQRLSRKDVAAFIIEIVQGEAGMIPAASEYLVKAQELCKQFGTLLIVDEVQTGLGRTGKLFAAEHVGIKPDIVCLSKALGGGLVSIGATLCTTQAWTDEFGQFHSSTFANNGLACSIASRVIDKLVENNSHLIGEIEKKGTYLRDQLEKLTQEFPGVFDQVTGMGLMQGLHLSPWSDKKGYFPMFASSVGDAVPLVCGFLMNVHGIITMPGFNQRNVLRIEPPLTIKYEEIDRLIAALRNVGHLIHSENFYGLVRYLISDNTVGHANAVSSVIDPSVPTKQETKREQDGQVVLEDPKYREEPIPAPDTFVIRAAAHEFPTVAAVEKGVRRLWATLGDLQAGRAIKVSTCDYNLLMEVVSEDFDSIVKTLDGPVHGTFVSRLAQIRDWIGVEDFGTFRERLDARREHCQLNVLQKNARHSSKGDTIKKDNEAEQSHTFINSTPCSKTNETIQLKKLELEEKLKEKSPVSGRFAFLMHPPTLDDLFKTCTPFDMEAVSEDEREKWREWLSSYSSKHFKPGVVNHSVITCPNGEKAEGWLIGIPLTARQLLRLKPPARKKLLDDCLSLAKELGADIVGLGAFTSVISRGGQDLVGSGIPITTGNSLTAMSSIHTLQEACSRVGKDFSQSKIAVIGAGGSIGSLASRYLVGKVKQLVLVGNPNNPTDKLEVLAGELYQFMYKNFEHKRSFFRDLMKKAGIPVHFMESSSPKEKLALYRTFTHHLIGTTIPPVKVNNECHDVLPHMDCVLSASSSPNPFLKPAMLSEGAVFCDVARPSDLLESFQGHRKNINSYEGGLIQLPEKIKFGDHNVLNFSEGINLACLSETIVLSMDRPTRNFSIGTDIPLEEAKAIFQKSTRRGFNPYLPEMIKQESKLVCHG